MDVSIPVSGAQVVAALCICDYENPCSTVYFGVGVYSQFPPAFLPRNDKNQSRDPWLLAPEQTDHCLVC